MYFQPIVSIIIAWLLIPNFLQAEEAIPPSISSTPMHSENSTDRPNFAIGMGASDITGAGFIVKQYLENSKELNYIVFISHQERNIEAGDKKQDQRASTYTLGLVYKKEITGKEISQFIFSRFGGGWFVGGHINDTLDVAHPRGESDYKTLEGALGGGLYLGADINMFRFEAALGLRYKESRSEQIIEEFKNWGKELIRDFTVGGGVSLTYGF